MAGPVGPRGDVAVRDRTRGPAPVGQRARPVLHQLEGRRDHRSLQHAAARVHKRGSRQPVVSEGECRADYRGKSVTARVRSRAVYLLHIMYDVRMNT